ADAWGGDENPNNISNVFARATPGAPSSTSDSKKPRMADSVPAAHKPGAKEPSGKEPPAKEAKEPSGSKPRDAKGRSERSDPARATAAPVAKPSTQATA